MPDTCRRSPPAPREVIQHGCVPVVISERLHPPFAELLRWEELALWVHEQDLPDLPRILRGVRGPTAGRWRLY